MISPQIIGQIAEEIASKGYVLLEHFLTKELALALLSDIHQQSAQAFKPAGIGRENDFQLDTKVRSDSTLWLNTDNPVQTQYLAFMEALRMGLNQRLFLGLFDFECHYSHYKKGDFYHKHLDAFKGRSNRVLSSVVYLNQLWTADAGGELLLYPDQHSSPIMRVSPVFNSCIIFLSDTFPHEVLESQQDRYSIAGWFRVSA